MNYNEFIKYVEIGHEFIGTIDSKRLKILNVEDEYTIIIIDDDVKRVRDCDMRNEIIYDNKTFEELFKLNIIKLIEMY